MRMFCRRREEVIVRRAVRCGTLNTYGLVEGLDKQLRNVFGELWWKLRPNEHAALVKRLYMRGWDWKFVKVTSKSNEKEPDLFYAAERSKRRGKATCEWI